MPTEHGQCEVIGTTLSHLCHLGRVVLETQFVRVVGLQANGAILLFLVVFKENLWGPIDQLHSIPYKPG